MRLLHVVPTYLPAVRYGGPIVAVHGLCKALVRLGHEVDVFTTNVDGSGESAVPVSTPILVDGVRVWYFRVPSLRRLYRAPDMAVALRKNLPQFDVVHLHSVYLWPTWAAARTAARRSVPYVVSPRGMLVPDLIRRKSRWLKIAWLRLIEQRNIERAAAIHVTSRSEAVALRQLGLRLPRLAEIPNGIDPAPERPVVRPAHDVVYIGRINWKKGLDRLIRAMTYVPDAELVIAGNDEEGYTTVLRRLADAQGVAQRVKFLPPVYHEAKWRLLGSARCFALASYSENFGNSVLEAMAVGCPVIVTPEVGASGIVADSGAGVVVAGDPETFGATIRRLLADPEALASMGERGRRINSTHSWDAVVERMADLYRSVIA